MASMFDSSYSLESITFGENFNTSNVESMFDMFTLCNELVSLDLSNFNTASVTDMGEMFYSCSALESITFGETFDTSNVENMADMFNWCETLTELDLSTFNTSNVEYMSNMFSYCSALTELDLSNFVIGEGVNVEDMFLECTPETIILPSTIGTPVELSATYYTASGKQVLWDDYSTDGFTSAHEGQTITKTKPVLYLYKYWQNKIPNLANITSIMFTNDSSEFSDIDNYDEYDIGATDATGETLKPGALKAIVAGTTMYVHYALPIFAPIDSSQLFANLNALTLSLGDLDTSNVENMAGMFFCCESLTELDLSSSDTSNVIDMSEMFSNCSSLTELDLSSFELVENIDDVAFMFYNCTPEIIILPNTINAEVALSTTYYIQSTGEVAYLSDGTSNGFTSAHEGQTLVKTAPVQLVIWRESDGSTVNEFTNGTYTFDGTTFVATIILPNATAVDTYLEAAYNIGINDYPIGIDNCEITVNGLKLIISVDASYIGNSTFTPEDIINSQTPVVIKLVGAYTTTGTAVVTFDLPSESYNVEHTGTWSFDGTTFIIEVSFGDGTVLHQDVYNQWYLNNNFGPFFNGIQGTFSFSNNGFNFTCSYEPGSWILEYFCEFTQGQELTLLINYNQNV